TLRKQLLYYILDKSKEDKKLAKKIFKLGLLESLSGKGLEAKALESVENKIEISINDIDSLFFDNFSAIEITIIKKIIQNRFEAINSITLLEMINRLALLSRLNLLLFKKISIFQFDELDNENNTLAFIKSMINTHLPDTILMMNMTPSSYHKISRTDSSIYDRLEKANFKIDLVGSNSFDEISDIVLAYIFSDKIPDKQQIIRNQLITILKVLYEDFDFRNIRSILNLMHAAFEIGLQKGLPFINEDCIHESLKIVYPGMKIKRSIMNISISEYIKIKSYFNSCTNIEDEIVSSIRCLLDSLEENKSPINNRNFSKDIYISYSKLSTGSTSANTNSSTTVLLEENVSNNYFYTSMKKNQNKFDSLPTKSVRTPKIFLDDSKIIDLLYYYYKVKENINTTEDDQKALILANALNLK
ncbi:MAG: hypothetical protein R3321_11675, partial [Nitrososphaeraceae archaeon]|nr:hypothetical protein [Nitrososphaeraceae archaeon]